MLLGVAKNGVIWAIVRRCLAESAGGGTRPRPRPDKPRPVDVSAGPWRGLHRCRTHSGKEQTYVGGPSHAPRSNYTLIYDWVESAYTFRYPQPLPRSPLQRQRAKSKTQTTSPHSRWQRYHPLASLRGDRTARQKIPRPELTNRTNFRYRARRGSVLKQTFSCVRKIAAAIDGPDCRWQPRHNNRWRLRYRRAPVT